MPAVPAWPPKSLPRLFVGMTLGVGAMVELDAAQANYVGNVMRLREGGELLLFDGVSGEWLARVAEAGKRTMILTVERLTKSSEAVPDLWLAFAPVKRGPVEWLVEKATELGVARMFPVVTKRTVVERLRLERLEAIMIEAAEQCGRTLLPAIAEPIALEKFLVARDAARTLYFADETGGDPIGAAFSPGPSLILTGPEGGFTPDERDMIRAQANSRAVSLGPRILRAETAALAAVAGWMALAGDWR
ncbi:MAG: 16S rRNA (uracil(1498)-N(3))-methyltransferase [Pseudomonadota bacterium]|nr:16S rRNA (uracil(1498)-N(3))-methyltransferase [Pseudomonadota bacterium]